MNNLLDRIDEIGNLPYEAIIVDAALQHEAEITDLNRRQLDKGLDSDGNSLGTYRPFTAALKGRTEPVDLKDTGAFRGSFDLKGFGTGFEVTASDYKTDELQDKYGDAILGIADDELRTVGEIVLDDVINEIRTRI